MSKLTGDGENVKNGQLLPCSSDNDLLGKRLHISHEYFVVVIGLLCALIGFIVVFVTRFIFTPFENLCMYQQNKN